MFDSILFIFIEIKIKFQYYVCCIFHLLEFEYALLFRIPALNFCHLAGGTVPSSGWRMARYRPRRHLDTDYALRWSGWLSEKFKVARRRHRTPDRPRWEGEPKTGDSSSCILFLRPTAWYSLAVPAGGAISAGVT